MEDQEISKEFISDLYREVFLIASPDNTVADDDDDDDEIDDVDEI